MTWKDRIWIALFTLVAGAGSLVQPFGRDQGNYAYAAWAWLQGDMPYRDVYVFKPPGTVFVHALALQLFGHSMLSIRWLDLFWTLATALALAAAIQELGRNRSVGTGAGMLYPVLYFGVGYWHSAQTDGWMNLPIALCLWQTLRGLRAKARAPAWFLGAGVALGAAVLLKYTAAVALLPLAVLLWRAERWPAVLASGLAGTALPLLLAAAWLVYGDAWPAFAECQSGLVSDYVQQTRNFGLVSGSWRLAADLLTRPELRLGGWLGLLGLAVVGAGAREPSRRWPTAVVLAWLAAGAANAVGQGKLFRYHELMALPGLAALGAEAGYAALQRLPRGRSVAGLAVGVLLFPLSNLPSTTRELVASQGDAQGRWMVSKTYHTGSFSLANDLKVAEHLRQATAPDERVFLWGYDPLINFVAERRTVSRFLYNYPFAVAWGRTDAYEAELMAALRAAPPARVVVGSDDATPHVTGNPRDSAALLDGLPDLKGWLDAGYRIETTIGRYRVYAPR